MNTIEVHRLRRVYRATIGVFRRKTKEVMAVDDISFDVKPGELFGLLGPNGAGKTITVKMLTTLLTTVSTSGLGLLMGCLSLITRNMMFVNNTVYFLLLVFCGANVPLTVLSGWMRAVSRFLPLTRGIASARQIISGAGLAEVAPLLVGELLIGLVYIFLGYSLFRWFEFQAKRRGTLEAI